MPRQVPKKDQGFIWNVEVFAGLSGTSGTKSECYPKVTGQQPRASFSRPQNPSSSLDEAPALAQQRRSSPSTGAASRGEHRAPSELPALGSGWEVHGEARSGALPMSERLQELSHFPLSKGRGGRRNHRLLAPAPGREIG